MMIGKMEVLRLWLSGLSQEAISGLTGRDRKTIRRYTVAAKKAGLNVSEGIDALTEEKLLFISEILGPGAGRHLGEGWKICNQYKKTIATLIVDNRDPLTHVHDFLLKKGAIVSYPTLRRYVSTEFGFARDSLTYRVSISEPGMELQLDFGRMGILERGINRKRTSFNAFIFTSIHTHYRFVYPTLDEETKDAVDACEAAWIFYGGVFRVLVPSDTRSILKLPVWPVPIINPAFLEYLKERKLSIDPTRTYYSKNSHRIDGVVEFVREKCFFGEKLLSIDDALHHAQRWCTIVCGMHLNKQTKRLPLEHFNSEEKGHLRSVPMETYEMSPSSFAP